MRMRRCRILGMYYVYVHVCMYMCMYVCMYVCVYVHVCIRICIGVCVCVCLYMFMYSGTLLIRPPTGHIYVVTLTRFQQKNVGDVCFPRPKVVVVRTRWSY